MFYNRDFATNNYLPKIDQRSKSSKIEKKILEKYTENSIFFAVLTTFLLLNLFKMRSLGANIQKLACFHHYISVTLL